jgi:hypothetical protein
MSEPVAMERLMRLVSKQFPMVNPRVVRMSGTKHIIHEVIGHMDTRFSSIVDMLAIIRETETNMFWHIFTHGRGPKWWCGRFTSIDEALEGVPDGVRTDIVHSFYQGGGWYGKKTK